MKKAVAILLLGILVGSVGLPKEEPKETEIEEIVETKEIEYLTDDDFSQLYSLHEYPNNDTCLSVSINDALLLMKIAMSEAGDNGVDAQLMIMNVVMNRVNSELFPNTIKEVIYADGQFAVVTNGIFDKTEPNVDSHVALARLESGDDLSDEAVYFESDSNSSKSWQKQNLTFVKACSGNLFYK